MNPLFTVLTQLEETYLSFWEDVCNIESPTADKAGVDAVGQYFIDKATAFGWQVEVQPQAVSGNCVCITMNPDAPGASVCFSGHMDTVHPVGSFGTPAVTRDGEKIYGPGVCDCKGGAVAGFYAMAALHQLGFSSRPVKLILQSDEEVSSGTSGKSTVRFMREKAEGCVAFLNCEGAQAGKATVSRKGILSYTFDITGKAVHSSKCNEGASAVTEAAHKIIALEKYKDAVGLTCNCSLLSGGESRNTVPGKCTFTADIRFATAAQLQEAKAFVADIAAKTFVPGTSCKTEQLSYRCPMELNHRNEALLAKINVILEQNDLSPLAPAARTGGSDAADITAYGFPCLDSLGVRGGKIHSRDEFAYLASLKQSATVLALAAIHL